MVKKKGSGEIKNRERMRVRGGVENVCDKNKSRDNGVVKDRGKNEREREREMGSACRKSKGKRRRLRVRGREREMSGRRTEVGRRAF